MNITHIGQHGADCFGCKVKTLNLDPGGPKVHMPKSGNPWEGNPVKERIEELTGITFDTDDAARRRPRGSPGKGPNAYF